MSLVEEIRAGHARRQYLMSPPNAVPDHGIEMRNGWPVKRPAPAKVVEPELKPLKLADDELPPARTWLWPREANGSPTIEMIQRAVCKHYNVSRADMLSSRRDNAIVIPRQVAYYLCRVMTPRSLPYIGRKFGGKDHSSVYHGYHKITRLRQEDEELDAAITTIIATLQPGGPMEAHHEPR